MPLHTRSFCFAALNAQHCWRSNPNCFENNKYFETWRQFSFFAWLFSLDSDYRTERRLFVFAKCPVCIFPFALLYSPKIDISIVIVAFRFLFVHSIQTVFFFSCGPTLLCRCPLECLDFKIGNHNRVREHWTDPIEWPNGNAGRVKSQFLFVFMANTCSGWLNGYSIEIQWRIRWRFFFSKLFRWKIINCECEADSSACARTRR